MLRSIEQRFMRSRYSLQPTAYSLQPTAYSLQPTAYSLQPTAYSLQPTAYSLQPTAALFFPPLFSAPNARLPVNFIDAVNEWKRGD